MGNDAYLWIIQYFQDCFLLNFLFYSQKAYFAQQYKNMRYHQGSYRNTIGENPFTLNGFSHLPEWVLEMVNG